MKIKKIAIQGFEGCFHQMAAELYFENIEIVPCATFDELIKKGQDKNSTDYAVMAIENSIAGSIIPNYNLLMSSELSIIGEVYSQITQNIMALPNQKMEDIVEVHSHPMALLQCKNYLKQYPNVKLVESQDTAISAKLIQETQAKNTAAIASTLAAKLYDLEILEHGAQTVKNNYTRFLVLSRTKNKLEDDFNKASIYIEVAHEKGSLAQMLVKLSELNINLSKLQSYPILGSNWSYGFYLDMEFKKTKDINNAIDYLRNNSDKMKTLGVYKNGKNDN